MKGVLSTTLQLPVTLSVVHAGLHNPGRSCQWYGSYTDEALHGSHSAPELLVLMRNPSISTLTCSACQGPDQAAAEHVV